MPKKKSVHKPQANYLSSEPPKASAEEAPKPSGQVELNHGNAPLLTAKFLELILLEIRKITAKLEKE
jgi:hypothetical protein